MPTPEVVVLWRAEDWRCELHRRPDGESRLEVYQGDVLVTAEATQSGHAAQVRADVLRQRVRRGDLRAN
jgi:hypothetical protein